MAWTLDENVQRAEAALAVAREGGAALCMLPELLLPGFHRRIGEFAQPGPIGAAVHRLQAQAAGLGMAVSFGAVTFDEDGRRFNSQIFIDGDGRRLGEIAKRGLTEPEATFFEAGQGRAVFPLASAGLRCTAVICREIEDFAADPSPLARGEVDLIVWPGQMRPEPGVDVDDPPRHVRHAMQVAQALGAWVVQANWPNALNRPEESAGCGRSAVIDPQGRLRFRLPGEAAGVAVFSLGDDRFDWSPLDGVQRAASGPSTSVPAPPR